MHLTEGSQKIKQESICSAYQNRTFQFGKPEHLVFLAQLEKAEHLV
jgi:hypothetical protein